MQVAIEAPSIGLGALPLKAQSLRSHALYLRVKCLHFLVVLFVLGFRRIGAKLFQRFFDREFCDIGHSDALVSEGNERLVRFRPVLLMWVN